MAVIGIDLGTTYSAAAVYQGDGGTEIITLDGGSTMPSVVGVQRNGKIVVGRVAKRNQVKNPQDTIVEVKRKMGTADTVRLGQKTFKAPEVSAMILQKIKKQAEDELGEPVTGAVVSCPAYFKDPQRQAITNAAKIADLELLNIINEPTAAAYAYGVSISSNDGKSLFLVYDLGGGTFDVTVVEMIGKNLKVIGTGGDPQLGGGNFDDSIADWMMEKLDKVPGYVSSRSEEQRAALKLRLKGYAEEAKIALCGPPQQDEYTFQIAQVDRFDGRPVVFNHTLSMEEFEQRISELLDNSVRWIDEAFKVPKEKFEYTEDDITEVLLVGGSTRVPAVRSLLEKRFPGKPIRGVESGINPDEVVARGAAIRASEADPDSLEEVDNVLVDVTGHTLSVEIMEQKLGRAVLFPLIPKETQIPTKAEHQFASQPRAPRSQIQVYQGEGTDPKSPDVMKIGEFLIEIDIIPEPTPLTVGLEINQDGLLVATALNDHTGRQVRCEINYSDSTQMSPEEVEKKRIAFEAQMNCVVGSTANPLDEQVQSPSVPPAFVAPDRATQRANPGAPADPTASMNPIMRMLYQKAINNFMNVPVERQPDLMTLVGRIEQAALADNTVGLASMYPELAKIMQGVQ